MKLRWRSTDIPSLAERDLLMRPTWRSAIPFAVQWDFKKAVKFDDHVQRLCSSARFHLACLWCICRLSLSGMWKQAKNAELTKALAAAERNLEDEVCCLVPFQTSNACCLQTLCCHRQIVWDESEIVDIPVLGAGVVCFWNSQQGELEDCFLLWYHFVSTFVLFALWPTPWAWC